MTLHRNEAKRSCRGCLLVPAWAAVIIATSVSAADVPQPFGIQVVDDATGRGVPLVELKTTNAISYVTDSAGWVAFDEPGMLGRKVFFHVAGHGYEFPKDGFGYRGTAIDTTPGGTATLQIKRLNIAERMYRVTGQGIYADSVRLGRPTPLAKPVLNGFVTGQDSVLAVVHRGRIHWFWGDTNRVRYPLGQFGMSAAVSELPQNGGLDPSRGVDLQYLVDDEGFSRPVLKIDQPNPMWIDGILSVADAAGQPRMVGHYSRMKDLGTRLEHGLTDFNDDAREFEIVRKLADAETRHPVGHAVLVTDEAGRNWFYFATPYPLLRVPAEWEAVHDPEQYQAFTPLEPGTTFDAKSPRLERDESGKIRYDWKRGTSSVGVMEHQALVKSGALRAEESWLRTIDAATDEPILLHGGTVRWNEFRRRWVMIAVQTFGEPSFLGEVWYAEAVRPEGPFRRAVRIVTHNKYSFYNPAQHAFFDQDGGRSIYFEGTYTHTFSGSDVPTPRYDYNQVMYRLNVADERLTPAQVDE